MYQLFSAVLVAGVAAEKATLVLVDNWPCGPWWDLYAKWFGLTLTLTDLQHLREPEKGVCFREVVTAPYSDFNEIGREYRATELQCAESPLFRMLADDLLRSQLLPLRGEEFTPPVHDTYCQLTSAWEAVEAPLPIQAVPQGKRACITLIMRKGKVTKHSLIRVYRHG
jgi:hypothetical protein